VPEPTPYVAPTVVVPGVGYGVPLQRPSPL
jgi:hypothetical protein